MWFGVHNLHVSSFFSLCIIIEVKNYNRAIHIHLSTQVPKETSSTHNRIDCPSAIRQIPM